MSATNACPECGLGVPPDATPGPCPRCRMDAPAGATATFNPAVRRGAGPAPAPVAVVAAAELLRALRELDLAGEEVERLASVSGDDAARLADVLVRARQLTPYQAKALLQGKARGLMIGPYLLDEKLGAGGMGVVFKARHRPSGRVVALKLLPPSFGRDPDVVRRFRREFQIASRLSHPNLVAAIEASEDRGVHYLTMEYIPGHDLDRLVAQAGPMDLKLALHCAIQVARGLEAAHAQGVIHRDIKPGNVMIDPAGAVRVLDLGLARVIEATAGFGQTAMGTLTQAGSYMGTVDFLAPEQANDARSADARADVYSLGCTLHFLLTGRPPFGGQTVLQRLMAHQDRPAPSLRAARPEVPEALEAAYLAMMAKRPGERPQTMSAVVIAMEACRTSAREAGDASVDLKTFARTALKRAPARGRRGPDASVIARPSPKTELLSFDPDLKLEDLVGGYRDELGHDEIPEEKLPPVVLRSTPRNPRGRRQPLPFGPIAFALIGSAAAISLFFWPKPAEVVTTPAPPVSAAIAPPESAAIAPVEPTGPISPAPPEPAALPSTPPDRAPLPPPTAVVDALRPGSVWKGTTGDRVFTVLERDGGRFKAMFVLGTIVREVNGTVGGGRLRWLARDVRAIAGKPGHDNQGEIRGEELAMTFTDPASGQLAGQYTLRLAKPASAFRPLFNGRDLEGWGINLTNANAWGVEDGHLVARGTGNYREQTYLLTKERYSDFIFRFEFYFAGDSDSGVGIRAEPGDTPSSLEVNLRNVASDPPGVWPATGAFRWSTSGRGSDYARPRRSDLLRPAPSWNEMSVEARGRSPSG